MINGGKVNEPCTLNKEVLLLKSVSKVSEIMLDDDINEQDFVSIIKDIFKKKCYIYAIIPEWEEELLNKLSKDFIIIAKFPLPLIRNFPRTKGVLGYLQDNENRYLYELYLKSTTMDFIVFSETDVSRFLNNITNKNINIYKIFEANKITHITIGPDGQWLNVVEY